MTDSRKERIRAAIGHYTAKRSGIVFNGHTSPRTPECAARIIDSINFGEDWSAERYADEARRMVGWAERDGADWAYANRECRIFLDELELARSECVRAVLRWHNGIAAEPPVYLPDTIQHAFIDMAERLLALTMGGDA